MAGGFKHVARAPDAEATSPGPIEEWRWIGGEAVSSPRDGVNTEGPVVLEEAGEVERNWDPEVLDMPQMGGEGSA